MIPLMEAKNQALNISTSPIEEPEGASCVETQNTGQHIRRAADLGVA